MCLTKFSSGFDILRTQGGKAVAAFAADLNELLVEIYRNIEILEESELKKSRLNLSISDFYTVYHCSCYGII